MCSCAGLGWGGNSAPADFGESGEWGKGLGEAGAERRAGTEGEEEGWRGKASLMGLKKLEERGFLRALDGEERD